MNNEEIIRAHREIELDFLRGIAILAVLDGHDSIQILEYPFMRLGFPAFGWVGVDLFFVLSGFLVGGLLVKEWRVRGRIDEKRFLIRRMFKIWPQYYTFILLTVLTGHHSLSLMWGSFVHLQNYFIGIPHLWTLAVEEHAYLLLVILLAVASRRDIPIRRLFFLVAGVCTLVVSVRLLSAEMGWPYIYTTHTRVEAIFYGLLLAMVFHYRPEAFRRMQSWRWLWVAAVAAALGFIWLDLPQTWVRSVTFDAANLLSLGVFMLLYRRRPGVVRPWSYRLVAWIGLYSYGIYLWHVSTTAYVMKLSHHLPGALSAWWIAVAQPLCGIALGVLMTKLVEFPMLRLRERWFPKRIQSPVEPEADEMAAGAA